MYSKRHTFPSRSIFIRRGAKLTSIISLMNSWEVIALEDYTKHDVLSIACTFFFLDALKVLCPDLQPTSNSVELCRTL